MHYREARAEDIERMARIRSGDWGTAQFWELRIAKYLAGEHHPQQALAPRAAFVAVDGDTLAGFVAGHLTRRFNCEGELQWLTVAPAYRRRGVASELLRLLASWFAQQRAFRICINVEPDNAGAIEFYRRHGAQALNRHWMIWERITTATRPSSR
jgi:ribosomal protein S18 acetylase RimI-like enzyme